MATHSNTLAWKIPWTEEPGRLHTVHVVSKSRTLLSDFTFLRRRNMSSSRTYYCDIIIGTEFKEKHTLEHDELFCYAINSSGLKQKKSYVTKMQECRKKKKFVLFSSQRAQTPFSFLGTPDLSTYLRISFLTWNIFCVCLFFTLVLLSSMYYITLRICILLTLGIF